MTEEPVFQCGACETAHDTAKDAMACCRCAERGVSRLTNWPDAIYEATGWVVSDGLAYAIGGMVEAARRDAAGDVGRLRAEVHRLRGVLEEIESPPIDVVCHGSWEAFEWAMERAADALKAPTP